MVIDALLTHADRKDGAKRRCESLADGEQRQRAFVNAKKITSGVMIKAGCYSINDPILLKAIKQKEEMKNMEQQAKDQKVKAKISSLRSQVNDVRQKRGRDPMMWNGTECRAFLQYKKQKGDAKMPTSLKQLQLLCQDWIQRPSPPSSPTTEGLC